MNSTRRDVLKAGGGAVAAGALAGCVDGLFETSDADGYAAFFALWDWAEQVAGDEMTFENPVETGAMGHGWEPDGDFTANVVNTGLFIYLDTEEFDWALDLVDGLETDHDGEVTVVDALQGLEPYFLPFDGGEPMAEPREGHEPSPEDLDFEFELWDLRNEHQSGWWHAVEGDEHWHGSPPDVAVGDTAPIGVVLFDRDGEAVDLGGRYTVDARVADGADESVLTIESHGDHVVFEGEAVGHAGVVFELYDGHELLYETPQDPGRTEVVEEYEEGGGVGQFDPHTWVDPVLAQRMVDNIAAALAEYDPDNEDVYLDNAEAYTERLQEVHEQFAQTIEDAALDRAIFLGHDSYQYVEHRYDFELVTPTGVSPDEEASIRDISDLDTLIREADIDTVLYDPFESARPGEDKPRLVQSIFENTDVDNAEPLSPVEGVTEEWDEKGWGWVEQMLEVNLASLERALNPE